MSYPRQLRAIKQQTDLFINQVVFLAHFDANFDSVIGSHVATLLGPPTLDTVTVLMGTNSYLNGSAGSAARYAPGAAIDYAGSLTIEFMMRPTAVGGGPNRYIYAGNGNILQCDISAAGFFRFTLRGQTVTTTLAPAINTTYSMAISAVAGGGANNVRSFVNGVLLSTDTIPDTAPATFTNLWVGNDSSISQVFAGRLDEFRITKAQRYTGNYVPATLPFPDN